jgi:hypothetical protein
MIDDKLAVPLSPPTSPHMSDNHTKFDEYQWQPAPDALLKPTASISTDPHGLDAPPDETSELLGQPSAEGVPVASVGDGSQQARPPLRSHKSFPYSLGPSSRANDDPFADQTSDSVLGDFRERVVSQGPQPTGNASLPQPSYGGSAPTSPANRLTPNSPNQEQNDALMEDEDLDLDMGEHEDETAEKVPKTAAELRAAKRKMKRFR